MTQVRETRIRYYFNRGEIGEGWEQRGAGFYVERLCENNEWRPEAGPFHSYTDA